MFLTVKHVVQTPFIPVMEFEELNTKGNKALPNKEL